MKGLYKHFDKEGNIHCDVCVQIHLSIVQSKVNEILSPLHCATSWHGWSAMGAGRYVMEPILIRECDG